MEEVVADARNSLAQLASHLTSSDLGLSTSSEMAVMPRISEGHGARKTKTKEVDLVIYVWFWFGWLWFGVGVRMYMRWGGYSVADAMEIKGCKTSDQPMCIRIRALQQLGFRQFS